jgi:hypothetical protein
MSVVLPPGLASFGPGEVALNIRYPHWFPSRSAWNAYRRSDNGSEPEQSDILPGSGRGGPSISSARRETPYWSHKEALPPAQVSRSLSRLPELVRDTRLNTIVQGKTTIHRRIVRRRGAPQEESWIRYDDSILGHGGGGLVWLEHKVAQREEEPNERRAVKAIRVPGGSPISEGLHCVRELEALAKFSQERVRDTVQYLWS